MGDDGGILSLSVGRGVRVGTGVVLEVWAGGTNELVLDDDAHVFHQTTLQLHSGTIRIGAGTLIRQYTTLKSAGELVVGDGVLITQSTSLHCTERIEIGDLCALGDCVSVVDSDHAHDGTDRAFLPRPVITLPVVIGRNVWVGRGCAILRGVRIGPNTVIGANSVLTGGEYPGGWLIAGSPAKELRRLGSGEPIGAAREH